MGSYALKVIFTPEKASSASYVTKSISVKAKILDQNAVYFTQSNTWSPPGEYEVQNTFPVQFTPKNTNENPIIHL